MKILATSDLHVISNKERTRDIANYINSSDADALVIAGDIATARNLEKALRLFSDFQGQKLAVAGNHDIWTQKGDSHVLYTQVLPELFESCGFHYLDQRPLKLGNVGFVGNIGWYDYSFARKKGKTPTPIFVSPDRSVKRWRDIKTKDYRRKQFFTHTEDGQVDVRTWEDMNYIRWNHDDKQFASQCASRLESDLLSIENDVDAVIAITHHVPFQEMIDPHNERVPFNFFKAYSGNAMLGKIMKKHKKVKVAICGHTHSPREARIKHITAYNVSHPPYQQGIREIII